MVNRKLVLLVPAADVQEADSSVQLCLERHRLALSPPNAVQRARVMGAWKVYVRQARVVRNICTTLTRTRAHVHDHTQAFAHAHVD